MDLNARTLADEYDSVVAENILLVLQEESANRFSFKEFGGWINVLEKKKLIAEIDPDESIIYASNPKSKPELEEISGFLSKKIGGDWEIFY